jgi:hypothetical protein
MARRVVLRGWRKTWSTIKGVSKIGEGDGSDRGFVPLVSPSHDSRKQRVLLRTPLSIKGPERMRKQIMQRWWCLLHMVSAGAR